MSDVCPSMIVAPLLTAFSVILVDSMESQTSPHGGHYDALGRLP